MKKIIVACGSGIATSTVARNALEEKLKEKGIDATQVSMDQTSIPQLRSKADQFDLAITTGKFTEDIGVPILNGLPFLTGIGEDALVEKVVDVLDLKPKA
ncbi:PTS sugar transporter subunit IIB [Lacticaseibacillus paracasei]|jgi:PTS system galactitol-specific IIB component|uniref:PTS sugar transporter subunit IIB n=1 Tax=Lacticaseibacillus paracasei TaxID=1597 RepID=UPI000975613B|nr:PTS sugar transporter subunit IIB [Lacticaseibacillus paracasei]MCB5815288.1 PTS sugar transporter subunit IIB [Lacticaseibacillus paracasei]MDK6821921.1 PTS sugar transporter subunit IIB [Lacticaseibacillus paracasei]MDK7798699.1 PTS sugar transporter subunit IIB [Lacticaseibacillus paracasei]RND97731.1 Galactitol-specific phosphotransferase enzyme IIB component [Lacticaseibacillus paracasei]RNE15746.1 Galactitol-specific phosphotransferase enzyme IIB component [Lacticaseibacillus paracase